MLRFEQMMLLGLFAVLALVFLPVINSNAAEMPEGLVLYYDFSDSGAGEVEDLSGFGNTGVIKGNPEWIDGPEGMDSGLRFLANSDYVETADSESLRPDDITIAVWIKSELTTGSIEMLRKYVWSTLGYLIKVEPDYDYTMFFLFDGVVSHGLMIPLVQKDVWEHVAVTFDGEMQVGYLNGELAEKAGQPGVDAVMQWQGPLEHTNTPLTIGGISGFKGAVDEIAIYNRALSAEEIKESAFAGHLSPVEPGGKLAATWAGIKQE